jgi:predicted nucleic acid-binding protein
MEAAELVAIAERIAARRDPTDDRFLELAVSGHAEAIVTPAVFLQAERRS